MQLWRCCARGARVGVRRLGVTFVPAGADMCHAFKDGLGTPFGK
jgi:hypothetical protein